MSDESRIGQALDTLMHAVNVSYRDTISDALMNEHPTLLGQFAKATAIGVMRRTMRDSTWKPFTPKPADVMWCHRENGTTLPGTTVRLDSIPHPDHDGRLDCSTIIGAELVARQSLI